MRATSNPLRIVYFVAGCAALFGSLTAAPSDRASETIHIWKVGSPHDGDIPRPNLPPAIVQDYEKQGYAVVVEAFPAEDFANVFADALTRNAHPDLLVFDNMGVIDGITTKLGRFDGIGQNPAVRQDMIRVTGAFDELLGPRRGWTYLFSSSPNHRSARALALRAPRCATLSMRPGSSKLIEMASALGAAYLERRDSDLLQHADPERVRTPWSGQETLKVGALSTCGLWGNTSLVFVSVKASYVAETAIGHAAVLMVFRNSTGRWHLLVAARDPISNDRFVKDLPLLSSLLNDEEEARTVPAPATILAPPDGLFPLPPARERFGTFSWKSSASADVVGEVGEFAYRDDARLFLTRPRASESVSSVSTGSLWMTSSTWTWRVWSIARSGTVTFSNVRTFVH